MPNNDTELTLTVVVTVVSGKEAMHHCLTALYPQVNFADAEIIVPFDKWSQDVGSFVSEFPEVSFHYIEDLGLAASEDISAHQHRLYDRRRAVGLQLARGRIIAMTEDHATPAENWCQQILSAHEQPYEVIGGAIENGVDNPLNRAWYYCDFGRYGRPFTSGEVNYVSDVNVAYKRHALMTVWDVWREAYHETTVHWALRTRGMKLFLDERMLVYQQRPRLTLGKVFRERIAWGRVFAETRVNACSIWKRFMFIVGAMLLPPLLFVRVIRHMLRQKRTLRQMATTLPLVFLLLLGWSFGELVGYVMGEPHAQTNNTKVAAQAHI